MGNLVDMDCCAVRDDLQQGTYPESKRRPATEDEIKNADPNQPSSHYRNHKGRLVKNGVEYIDDNASVASFTTDGGDSTAFYDALNQSDHDHSDFDDRQHSVRMSALQVMIEKADGYFRGGGFDKSAVVLTDAQRKFPKEAEVLWRLSRVHFMMSQETRDHDTMVQMLEEGSKFAEQALEADDQCMHAHKWFAILAGKSSFLLSTSDKIKNAFAIKEHATRASALDPSDATNHHLLGQWCLNMAEVGWFERKLASVLYETPPSATYEEALEHFMTAYELHEDFIENVVAIGDTHALMDNTEQAKDWYRKALAIPPLSDAQRRLHAQTTTKLNELD